MVDRTCQCCGQVIHHCHPSRRFCAPCQATKLKDSIKRSNLKRSTMAPRGAVFDSKHNGTVIVTTCPVCKREVRYPELLCAIVGMAYDQIPCNRCSGGRE